MYTTDLRENTYLREKVPDISIPFPRLAGSHTCLGGLYTGVLEEPMPKISPRSPGIGRTDTYYI